MVLLNIATQMKFEVTRAWKETNVNLALSSKKASRYNFIFTGFVKKKN